MDGGDTDGVDRHRLLPGHGDTREQHAEGRPARVNRQPERDTDERTDLSCDTSDLVPAKTVGSSVGPGS